MTAAPRTPVRAGELPLAERDWRAYQELVRGAAGISLGEGKRTLLVSRLARRLRHHGLDDYGSYLALASSDPVELQAMINCITTNKTSFFREAHHFDFLRRRLLEPAAREGRPVRLWSAGCSTGEEPYTIALVAREALGVRAEARLDILASDIDTEVLERAARAVYEEEDLAEVPEALRSRGFLRGTGAHAGLVRVRPEVRGLVRFAQVNLVGEEWPVEPGLDAVFCRNVIIYFDHATQRRLMERFAALLRPGGHLFLGHSENIAGTSQAFEALGQTVYRLRAARPASRPAAAGAPLPRRNIIAGEVHASAEPMVIRTLLGSCVAACLYDPVARVGGMNHFMLPGRPGEDAREARYGVHAMELLINELMRLGADRRRLVAKAFGAGAVLRERQASLRVPEQNARFVREFLAAEGIPLVAERLGGTEAVEVLFDTATGKARVAAVRGATARSAVSSDERYRRTVSDTLTTSPAADVTLF